MSLHIHIHRRPTRDAAPKPKAAGVVYLSPENRVLLLLRAADSTNGGTWGLPAGGIEHDESPWEAAHRECWEETGFRIRTPMRHALTEGGFACYATRGPMFIPTLNREHTAYVWAHLDSLPTPLHPNLKAQLAVARMRADK